MITLFRKDINPQETEFRKLFKKGYRICAIFKSVPHRVSMHSSPYTSLEVSLYFFLFHDKNNKRIVRTGISSEQFFHYKRKDSKVYLKDELYYSTFYYEVILPWTIGKNDASIPMVHFEDQSEGEFFQKLSDQKFINTFNWSYV